MARPGSALDLRLEQLALLSESVKGNVFLSMDVEEVDQPGQVQQGLQPVLNVEQLHLAARLPDNAIAAGELAQAIAVYEIHAGKIDKELLKTPARKDVNQISELSVTIAQRQPADNIYDDDAILLSRSQLKSHSLVAQRFLLPGSYSWFRLLSSLRIEKGRPPGKSGTEKSRPDFRRVAEAFIRPGEIHFCGRFGSSCAGEGCITRLPDTRTGK
jgi:hypothetical protein